MIEQGLVSICIVVATEQNVLDLEVCLPAVAAQTYHPLEVVVVSNQAPGSWEAITRKLYPEASCIEAGSNLGYSGANNIGIAESRGTYFMPLNPDVALHPRFVSEMVEHLAADRKLGLANGKLYSRRDLRARGGSDDRIIDITWLSIEKRRRQFCEYQFKEDSPELDRPREVFGADGAAPMYKRSMLDDIRIAGEYYDPLFFCGKEDLDVSWRARLLGWRCVFVPTAVAYHRRTFTPTDRRRNVPKAFRIASIRNRYLVIIRNDLLSLWLRHLPRILAYDIAIFSYVLLREPESLRAYWDVIRNLPDQLHKRREIMKKRRVGARELAPWFV